MIENKPLIFLLPLSASAKKLKTEIEQTAEDDNVEVFEIDSIEEAGQLISALNICVMVTSSPKKCAQVLQRNRKSFIGQGSKAILITSKTIPFKTLQKFSKIGLTESIEESASPKTILYKVNLLLRSISQKMKSDEMQRATLKSLSSEENEDSKKFKKLQPKKEQEYNDSNEGNKEAPKVSIEESEESFYKKDRSPNRHMVDALLDEEPREEREEREDEKRIDNQNITKEGLAVLEQIDKQAVQIGQESPEIEQQGQQSIRESIVEDDSFEIHYTENLEEANLKGKGSKSDKEDSKMKGKSAFEEKVNDSPLAGKSETEKLNQDPLSSKVNQPERSKSNMSGISKTETLDKGPLLGKENTTPAQEGKQESKVNTDSIEQLPLSGSGKTQSLKEDPLSGKVEESKKSEEQLEGNSKTDDFKKDPLGGRATSENIDESPLSAKTEQDPKQEGNLAGRSQTESLKQAPLSGSMKSGLNERETSGPTSSRSELEAKKESKSTQVQKRPSSLNDKISTQKKGANQKKAHNSKREYLQKYLKSESSLRHDDKDWSTDFNLSPLQKKGPNLAQKKAEQEVEKREGDTIDYREIFEQFNEDYIVEEQEDNSLDSNIVKTQIIEPNCFGLKHSIILKNMIDSKAEKIELIGYVADLLKKENNATLTFIAFPGQTNKAEVLLSNDSDYETIYWSEREKEILEYTTLTTVPTWKDKRFLTNQNSFIFPYYEDTKLLGISFVEVNSLVKHEQSYKFEILLESLRCCVSKRPRLNTLSNVIELDTRREEKDTKKEEGLIQKIFNFFKRTA